MVLLFTAIQEHKLEGYFVEMQRKMYENLVKKVIIMTEIYKKEKAAQHISIKSKLK